MWKLLITPPLIFRYFRRLAIGSVAAMTALQFGLALKAACADLPRSFRECHLVCYRCIALDKRGVMNLLGSDNLTEKVSSWTVNTGMKGGVPFPDTGDIGAIFYARTAPDAASIIVSLRALYQDQSSGEGPQQKGHLDKWPFRP